MSSLQGLGDQQHSPKVQSILKQLHQQPSLIPAYALDLRNELRTRKQSKEDFLDTQFDPKKLEGLGQVALRDFLQLDEQDECLTTDQRVKLAKALTLGVEEPMQKTQETTVAQSSSLQALLNSSLAKIRAQAKTLRDKFPHAEDFRVFRDQARVVEKPGALDTVKVNAQKDIDAAFLKLSPDEKKAVQQLDQLDEDMFELASKEE